jgi:KDO2-lipid IV(A) lauroyltransferase
MVYAGMWFLSLLPFKVLYVISDIGYFFVYHVVHYRRRVTERNLRNSFPDKSSQWLKQTEKKFYHYLCDYLLEDIKLMHISLPELEKRMLYMNTEQYLRLLEKYGGLILLIPHYANYEWIIGMGGIMPKGDIPVQLYKPLHDPYLDALFKKIRARFGGLNVPKHSAVREILKLKRDGTRMVIGFITDQCPNRSEAHYWTRFLNQDTVFMDGAERIAKLIGYPVFYCALKKTGRGYCQVDFQLVTEFPKDTAEGEITEQFARRVEQTIFDAPAYWLWSHKRWKYKREDFIRHE